MRNTLEKDTGTLIESGSQPGYRTLTGGSPTHSVPGVRRDDLHSDHGACGARTSRHGLNKVLESLQEGDNRVITTLDRLI